MSDDQRARAERRVGVILEDKWRLERLIGTGGMAAVYAARHRNGSFAALKLLHPHLARNEVIRTRFLREGYAANRVRHPGVVRVIDDSVIRGGEDEGAAYLVMELLEGESVADRYKRNGGPLSEHEVLSIVDQVLEVLEAAHAEGVIHRDLKPDNLFIVAPTSGARGGGIKVLDFGIARIADGSALTLLGAALGTPAFMAPEQATGRLDQIDGRSDLFSVGATMFRLLTGRRVHDASSPSEVLAKMATLPAPLIRSVAPALSPTIASIVDRALQFRREDRYESARAMRADVGAALATISRRPSLVDGPTSGPTEASHAVTSVLAPTPQPPAPMITRAAPIVPTPIAPVLTAPMPLAAAPASSTVPSPGAQLPQPIAGAPPQPASKGGAGLVIALAIALVVIAGGATGAYFLLRARSTKGTNAAAGESAAAAPAASATVATASDDSVVTESKRSPKRADCERWGARFTEVMHTYEHRRTQQECTAEERKSFHQQYSKGIDDTASSLVSTCRENADLYRFTQAEDDCFMEKEDPSAWKRCHISPAAPMLSFVISYQGYKMSIDSTCSGASQDDDDDGQ